jgi:hypothetical protein
VIDVDHVVQALALRVPEANAERVATAVEEIAPARRVARADGERVQPQRLHLHRLADARRDHVVAELGVHPRELDAGLARVEQPVGCAADPVARAAA